MAISVAAFPMSIWPQAMLYFLPSSDVDRVRPVTACFVAVYGAEFGRGTCAEIDPLLMIRPPCGVCRFIKRNASWVQKNGPLRFVWTTRCHCSAVRSSNSADGIPTPALLNNRSKRPNACSVCEKKSAHRRRISDVGRDGKCPRFASRGYSHSFLESLCSSSRQHHQIISSQERECDR